MPLEKQSSEMMRSDANAIHKSPYAVAALENRHLRGASKSTVNRLWVSGSSHDYTRVFGLSSVNFRWLLLVDPVGAWVSILSDLTR